MLITYNSITKYSFFILLYSYLHIFSSNTITRHIATVSNQNQAAPSSGGVDQLVRF